MKNLVAIIKEILEFFLREITSFFKYTSLDTKLYKKFKNQGYLILEKKLNGSLCDKIIKSFEESVSKNNTWLDETGSDTRLFYAQDYIKEIDDILNDELFNSISTKFYGKKIKNKFSLMNRVVPVEGNLGSGGGWHRDSPTTHQLKVMIYLSDVKKGNGQFQYLEKSFRKSDIFKSIFKYNWGGKYRYEEKDILRYTKDFGSKIIDIIGDKGTIVIVDTKGIHRGSPIINGKRYAIFNYYYKNNIPQHFLKYKKNG